jgi:hypothetical protein
MRNLIMHNKLRGRWGAAGGALVVCLALLSGVARADFERSFSFDSDELRVANLIGAMEVRPASGNSFQVTVRVQGEDASAERITFEESGGRRSELAVLFPVDETERYVYPALGSNSRTRFSSRNHDNLLGQLLGLGRDQIEVRGRPFRGALEIWADVVIEVPQGKRLAVFLGVGAMDARDVAAELELDSQTGRIDAQDINGNLLCDTGSGSVTVRGATGDVDVDTGSGSVEISDVQNARFVRIDTGSGSVVVERVTASTLSVDTGSGGVDVDGANVEDLKIDTGSGGVEAYEIACDDASIDTGSGSVRFELVRMGRGRYDIDTGSGGIRVHLPHEISASFQADTGSGGISVDIEGVELTRRQQRDGEASFTVGGGESRFRLSTGSGSIRIVQARRG